MGIAVLSSVPLVIGLRRIERLACYQCIGVLCLTAQQMGPDIAALLVSMLNDPSRGIGIIDINSTTTELVVGRYRDKLTQVAGEGDEPSVNMSVNFHIRKDRQERVTPASENLTSITILLSAFMIGTHLFFVGYQDTVATHYDMGTRSGCSKSYMTMSESSLSALFDVKTASRLSLDMSASYSL